MDGFRTGTAHFDSYSNVAADTLNLDLVWPRGKLYQLAFTAISRGAIMPSIIDCSIGFIAFFGPIAPSILGVFAASEGETPPKYIRLMFAVVV